MDYFVSIEDTTYHHWQIELLLESFKHHKLLDNIVVAIAKNDEPKALDFIKNLRKVKRVFYHENLGQKRNYLPINKPYSLQMAIKSNLVKQPFALIEPDMVLGKPIDTPINNITFQINSLLTKESACQKNIKLNTHIKDITKIKKMYEEDFWISLGNTIVFNNVPEDLFKRALEWTEILEYESRKNTNESWWYAEKIAWVLSMLEYHGHLKYKGVHDYEMTLVDSGLQHNLIHYKYGFPSHFNKKMFTYKEPMFLSMGNPYEVMKQNNSTTCTNYVSSIIDSYLSEKKNFKINKEVGVVLITK